VTWRGRLALLLAALLCGCAGAPPAALPDSDADALTMREHPERLIVLAVANPKDSIATQAGSTVAGYTIAPRYAAGSDARRVLSEVARDYSLRELAGWPIPPLRLHCVVLEIPQHKARDAMLAELARDRRVALAQPLQTFATYGSESSDYNDPYVGLQVGFKAIEAGEAHRLARGQGVRIAVIDTGVDTSHPDLQGSVAGTRNFVDRDTAQFVQDRHGTEVAGVIAAVANNRQGIVGVAPEARLTVFKACWQAADGQGGSRCNSFTLAQALAAGIADGAPIINLSLGGPPDELLGRLVALAVQRGRIVVGAVPPDGNLAGFPVGVPGVIAVAVSSSAPAVPTRGHMLQAPGRDILTLLPGGRYDFGSGSSLAAAHASAAAALLLSAEPGLDAARVRDLLEQSQLGADSINVCAALAALHPDRPCGTRTALKRSSP
jgi:subtilisin family serine protease